MLGCSLNSNCFEFTYSRRQRKYTMNTNARYGKIRQNLSLYINWKSEMIKWNIRRSPPNLHILYALGSSSLYSVSFGIMPINLYTQSCYHLSLLLLELLCTCVFFIICAVDTIENPFIHTLQSTINKYCFLPSFIP